MTKRKAKTSNVKSGKKFGKAKTPEKTPEIVIEGGRRYKLVEYIEFVKWSALPTWDRDPEDQNGFAKKWAVSIKTLSEWKDEQFWSDVAKVRQAHTKDKMADVVAGLYKACIKHGRGADVKVFAQLAGEMKEDGNSIVSLSPELETAIAKIGAHLPN